MREARIAGNVLAIDYRWLMGGMQYNQQFYSFAFSDVNTTIFKNGNHTITITITNLVGSSTSQSGTLKFQNDCSVYPFACP